MTKSIVPYADVTEINVGVESALEVLYCQDDKAFYIAVPQLAQRFSFPIKHASRDLKALLGKDFSFLKFRTKLNSKAVNAIKLAHYEIVVAKLDRKGNEIAQAERDAMAGLSYIQLASDAFGIIFDATDRAAWMKARRAGVKSRLETTDAVKLELVRTGKVDSPNSKWAYARWTDNTYKHLFGATAKQMREFKGLAKTATPRDYLSEDAILRLTHFEEQLGKGVERLGLTLEESFNRAVQCYDPMPEHLIFKSS